MKEALKKNWYWILIVAVLLSIINVMRVNNNLTKSDTQKYETVNTKKEAVQESNIPDTIVKKFTEIKTVTRYVDRIKIDTVVAKYKDTVPCIFERSGFVQEPEYNFTYETNQKGFRVYNMQLHDSLLIVTGTKRKWFLGKEINTIDISHTNKYISSDQVQHIEVVNKKKFYETTFFKFAVGFGLGVVVAK